MSILISDPLYFLSHFPLFCIAGTVQISDPPLEARNQRKTYPRVTNLGGGVTLVVTADLIVIVVTGVFSQRLKNGSKKKALKPIKKES